MTLNCHLHTTTKYVGRVLIHATYYDVSLLIDLVIIEQTNQRALVEQ